jgi:hypothetical protein
MNKSTTYILWVCLLLPLATVAAPNDNASPQDVITRLVGNASKNPLGPVENDVTDQTVQTANTAAKDLKSKDVKEALRESIVTDFIAFTLEGPLTSLYSGGSVAIFYGKVNLTEDDLADHRDVSCDPSFGDTGFSAWVGPKTIDDAHVIATFCLVQQHGSWKVHCVYLSNDVIEGSNKAFIVSQLAAFAKKS